MRITAIAITVCMLASTFCTKADDSIAAKPEYRFQAKELIAPAALIAVGTFGVYNNGFKDMNRDIADKMSSWRGNHHFKADDYIQYLPMAAYLGLGAVGMKCKHPFRERLVTGATSYIVLSAITGVAKYTIKEMRPDGSNRHSFPSGHAARAFAGAELMREEYGLVPGIAAYTVATGVAFLRLYNGKHWLNDVIAGAGVGILSARIGYWMLPVYRRWFHWEDTQQSASHSIVAIPAYDFEARGITLNFAMTF